MSPRPPTAVSTDKAWLCARGGGWGQKAGAKPGASKRDKLGPWPAGNSQGSGELVDSKGVGRELEEEMLSLHP